MAKQSRRNRAGVITAGIKVLSAGRKSERDSTVLNVTGSKTVTDEEGKKVTR